MENLKQRIERLQIEKKTQHRPELLSDPQYADWLDSLSVVSDKKVSNTTETTASVFKKKSFFQ